MAYTVGEAEGRARGDTARPVVLIVDDESSIRESLAELFVDDADVVVAESRDAALLALKDHALDLIITDLRLGARRDGGFQVMAAGGLLAPDAPIIALTAYPDEASRAASRRLGATHFLEKPADLLRVAALAAAAGVQTALVRRSDVHDAAQGRPARADERRWSVRRTPPGRRGG